MRKILCFLTAAACLCCSIAGAHSETLDASAALPGISATLERFAELQQADGQPVPPVAEGSAYDGKTLRYLPYEGLVLSGGLAAASDKAPTYTLSIADNSAFAADTLLATFRHFLMAVEPSLTLVVADELLAEIFALRATIDEKLEHNKGVSVFYHQWTFELVKTGVGVGSLLTAHPSMEAREEPPGTSLARLGGVYLRFLSCASYAGYELNDDITPEYDPAEFARVDHYRMLADGLTWQELFDGEIFFGWLLQVDLDSPFDEEFETLFRYFLLSYEPNLEYDEIDAMYAYLESTKAVKDGYLRAELAMGDATQVIYMEFEARKTVAILESRLPEMAEDARIDIRNMDEAYLRFRALCEEEDIPLNEDAPSTFVDGMWYVYHPVADVEWGYGVDLEYTVYIYLLADMGSGSLTKEESFALAQLTLCAVDTGYTKEDAEALLQSMRKTAVEDENEWLISETEENGIHYRLTETASGYSLAVVIPDPVRGNQDK